MIVKQFCHINITSILLFLIISTLSSPSIVEAAPLEWHQSVGISSYSQEIKVSQADPNIIFASYRNGSMSGLFKSLDKGSSFHNVFAVAPDRDVNAIAIGNSSSSLVWISTYEQGVFKSTNGGLSWAESAGILPKKTRYLTIDPQNDNVLFAGTGEHNSDGGIYKSADSGNNWSQIGADTYGNKNNLNIAVSKHDSNTILAGSDFSLYRSVDSGNTWSAIFNKNTYPPATLIDIEHPLTLYTSVPGEGIYKSTDNGLAWSLKNNGVGYSLIFRLVQDPEGKLFASRIGGGVWMSEDRGESWENVGDPSWGNRNTWGLDVGGERVFVSVEGLGIFYADTAEQIPTVFIPGFGGSWSYKGLIENQPTTYSDWQLMPLFTDSIYKPVTSLPNVQIFAYDFRKSITATAIELNTFLSGKKADIITHSMGSLVARYCFEKVPSCADKINKITTAGGPHLGTIKAYQLWEGAQLPIDDPLTRLMLEIALPSHDINYIRTNFPGVKDLLPIFDYITGKPYNSLSSLAKNPNLESLTPSANFKSILTTWSGDSTQTAASFTTTLLNVIDKALGLWVDGKPNVFGTAIGDGTILQTSSQIPGAVNENYPVKHDEYFTKAPSDITSALAFVIHSPANISSTVGTNIDNKAIFIANPTTQNYPITLIGTGNGNFQLDAIGVYNHTAFKKTISGQISTGSTYQISFDYALDPSMTFTDSDGSLLLASFRQKSSQTNNRFLKTLEAVVVTAFNNLKNNRNRPAAFIALEKAYTDALIQNVSVAEQLYTLIVRLNQLYGSQPTTNLVEAQITRAQKAITAKLAKSSLTSQQATNLQTAQKYLEDANQLVSAAKLYHAYLLSRGALVLAN